MEKPSIIKPAVIAGIAMGFLSIIPIIGLANCCCLWIVGGGAFGAWLYKRESYTPISALDGFSVGALSGFIGGIIHASYTAVVTFVQIRTNPQMFNEILRGVQDPKVAAMLESYFKFFSEHFLVVLFASAMFTLVSDVITSAVGGLLAAVIFEKRQQAPTYHPPQTPQYFTASTSAPVREYEQTGDSTDDESPSDTASNNRPSPPVSLSKDSSQESFGQHSEEKGSYTDRASDKDDREDSYRDTQNND